MRKTKDDKTTSKSRQQVFDAGKGLANTLCAHALIADLFDVDASAAADIIPQARCSVTVRT